MSVFSFVFLAPNRGFSELKELFQAFLSNVGERRKIHS